MFASNYPELIACCITHEVQGIAVPVPFLRTMMQPEDETGRSEKAPDDEPFHLAKAAEEELKRLATHPVEEVHRLQEEAREGRWGSSLFLLVAEIGIGVWLLAALLMVVVFLIAYFVAR
jgi:hypothetical protein